jgi:enoyl-CoA hydratase/carnithine racemase
MTDAAPDLFPIRLEGDIAVATMNDARRKNPFSQPMREALVAGFHRMMQDTAVRAIVLTGAGKDFCAGGDISEMRVRPLIEGRERVDTASRLIRHMVMGPKPVVVAVEGVAFGAGLSMTAAADHAVAANNSRFSCAFVRIGLVPDTGTFWSLPRRVGAAKAWELMSLGTEINAAEALRLGLVDALCEPGQTLEAALAVARRYAALPPVALALMKRARATASEDLETCLRMEADLQPLAMRSHDHQEATKAFLEKRKPVFTGE